MQSVETGYVPEFVGTEPDRAVADEALRVMRATGRFFSASAAIRVSLESLAAYFATRHPERTPETWASELDRILSENTAVFRREEADGRVVFATTPAGRAPEIEASVDDTHTLRRRFQEPVPLPERPAAPPRVERERGTEEVAPAVEPAAVTAAPEATPVAEPVVEVEADITALSDDDLADLIARTLRSNPTVANFGDLWMVEDATPRLSRGDLRRIHEYILERNQPVVDVDILQDALGIRRDAPDFDVQRFAVNYRLLHEPREFEFVGTETARYWTTTGLPSIGTTKRKASEIGQDYRFLLDLPPVPYAGGEAVVEHVLTFYEYFYGVLPFDEAFQSLFPRALLPDQRAAVIPFESPQTYETFFAELRYPTGNRGGYIAGLEQFFRENLVPGALITVELSDEDGRYLLEYLPISGQDRKLLDLDEKRGIYVFRSTTFYCATQENMLLSENRFPRLANQSPLDERTKRRPELVLARTFERIGDREQLDEGLRYMAILDDLVAAANIERPMSPTLIRSIVRSDAYPMFTEDPDVEDVFYYEPQDDESAI